MVEAKIFIGLMYVVRVVMAFVAGFLCWGWGYGIDNTILVTLGYFLALMFMNLEAMDESLFLVGKLYSGTLIAVPISYVFLSTFGGMSEKLCEASSTVC